MIVLTLLAARLCAAEPDPVRRALDAGEPWRALALAEERSAAPGLSDLSRAAALRAAGRIRLELGDAAGAERELKRSVSLRPDDAGAWRDLAVAVRERPSEALEAADHANAPRLKGEIQVDLGDLAGAEESLKKAVERDASDLDAWRDLALLKRSENFVVSAASAAAAAPLWYRASAQLFCARLWLELGSPAKAAESAVRAARLEPDRIDALELLERLKLGPTPLAAMDRDAERPPSDLDAFSEAASDAPLWRQADAFRLIARARLAGGEKEKARAALRRAANLDPDSPATLSLAAAVAQRWGKDPVWQETRPGPENDPLHPALEGALARAAELRFAVSGDPKDGAAALAAAERHVAAARGAGSSERASAEESLRALRAKLTR